MCMDIRSAGVLVSDCTSVLLAKRNTSPQVKFPGYWAPFAGAIEAGESAEDAAKRELFEESRIKVKGELFLLSKVIQGHSLFYLYLYKVQKIPFPVIDFEHTEWGVFNIDSISVSPTPIDVEIIKAIEMIQKTPKL